MKLLIDLGNTRLKCALWDGVRLHRGATLTHARGNEHASNAPADADFSSLWQDLPEIESIWIASVAASSLEQTLVQSLSARFAASVRFARSPAMACGVRNAYSAPARLGVDRFLGLIAAHRDTAGAAGFCAKRGGAGIASDKGRSPGIVKLQILYDAARGTSSRI